MSSGNWHICVNKLAIIGSDNGLSPGRRQAIIWTNAGILLIGPHGNRLQWNLNRNLCIFIQKNAFENVIWKLVAILSRPQCVNTHECWRLIVTSYTREYHRSSLMRSANTHPTPPHPRASIHKIEISCHNTCNVQHDDVNVISNICCFHSKIPKPKSHCQYIVGCIKGTGGITSSWIGVFGVYIGLIPSVIFSNKTLKHRHPIFNDDQHGIQDMGMILLALSESI